MEVNVGDLVRFEAYYISNGKDNVRIADRDYTGIVMATFTDNKTQNFVKVNIGSRDVMVHKQDIFEKYR
jgi:hypothetical protein